MLDNQLLYMYTLILTQIVITLFFEIALIS